MCLLNKKIFIYWVFRLPLSRLYIASTVELGVSREACRGLFPSCTSYLICRSYAVEINPQTLEDYLSIQLASSGM